MKPLTEWMLPAPAGHEEMVFFVDMSSTTAPQEGAATCWVWLELAQGKAPVSEPDAKWEWAQKRHHELMALYHKDLQRVGADLALLSLTPDGQLAICGAQGDLAGQRPGEAALRSFDRDQARLLIQAHGNFVRQGDRFFTDSRHNEIPLY